jgi:F-type H+-transporting ATPase subunit gamma
MELVSTSKMKRAQDKVSAARPYAAALAATIADLWAPDLADQFTLLRRPTVDLHAVGKKGAGFFKYLGRKLASDRPDIGDSPTMPHALSVIDALLADFAAGKLAAVEMIQARFNSALSTPPALVPVLPIEPPKQTGKKHDYILKPDAATLLEALLPLYARNLVYRGLVETAAAEHAARRTAMKNATDNASDLILLLTRIYNKNRQAVITQEIAEIVGGAAALEQ